MTSELNSSGCLGCKFLKMSCYSGGDVRLRDFNCTQNPKRFAQIVSEQPHCYTKAEPSDTKKPPKFKEVTFKKLVASPDKGESSEDSLDLIALISIMKLLQSLYRRNSTGVPVITGDLKRINITITEASNIIQERLADG